MDPGFKVVFNDVAGLHQAIGFERAAASMSAASVQTSKDFGHAAVARLSADWPLCPDLAARLFRTARGEVLLGINALGRLGAVDGDPAEELSRAIEMIGDDVLSVAAGWSARRANILLGRIVVHFGCENPVFAADLSDVLRAVTTPTEFLANSIAREKTIRQTEAEEKFTIRYLIEHGGGTAQPAQKCAFRARFSRMYFREFGDFLDDDSALTILERPRKNLKLKDEVHRRLSL